MNMKEYGCYKGKRFSIMGDSISTLFGFNPKDYAVFYEGYVCNMTGIYLYASTWWGQVIDALGGDLLVNNSYSGSTVCCLPGYLEQSCGCSDERCSALGREGESPDVVMIYMGTNDWGCGADVKSEKNSLSMFRYAYSTMLDKIKKNYRDAEIWCFTLSKSICSASPEFLFSDIRHGVNISEFCRIIGECATEKECKLINIFEKENKFDTFDGFHPNLEGMKTLSKNVLESI